MKEPKLTDKQRLFIKLYMKYLNASKAYREAYQAKEATADTEGPALLGNPRIAAELKKMKDKMFADADLLAKKVIDELQLVAFADTKAIADKVRRGEELTEEESRLVVSADEFVTESGTLLKVRCTQEKAKCLELLGKYLKLFTDKVEHGGKVDSDNKIIVEFVGKPEEKA